MEVAGFVVAVSVAIGGWIASGALARRDARRRTRVEFLISAYRRLDRACNRPMSSAVESDLESAVSDIQLFGSAKTIDLAVEFSRTFASERRADPGPLLEALRRELRDELQLPAAPDEMVWLRIDRGVDWSNEAIVVRAELGEVPTTVRHAASGPAPAAVEGEFHRIEGALIDVLGDAANGHPVELAQAALDKGLISAKTERAVRGLSAMHDLAVGQQVTPDQEREFAALVAATIFAIEADSSN